jgi:ATP-grasp domain-containing protein
LSPYDSGRLRQVLLVCPQERDFREIRAAGLASDFDVLAAGSDLDDHDDAFDPARFVREHAARAAGGVVGTKDRSALLAALIAERAGLAGPRPAALLACQHKPTSRELQRAAAPEAVPRFQLLNRAGPRPAFPSPFFVKPVVGRLSENARRIDSPAQLRELDEDGYPPRYAPLAALAGLPEEDVHGFLAEELLAGAEVTLEGYVHRRRVTTIGVTDSLKYPGTNSFEGFAFPSALPRKRLDELAGLAARVLPAHGFDDGFFNMELFVPPVGPAKLIEVNGRIASQFAPLVRAVQGRSTYEALFRLACGDDPAWSAAEPRGVAISYCLRVFEDAFVAAVPDTGEDVEILVGPGRRLSEQGTNDAESYRLAIFHEWGRTREEALDRCRARAAGLAFELVPARLLAAAAGGDG